jgi:hypothetical protein
VKTRAPIDRTPYFAALGKIACVIGNDDMRIERMTALSAIAELIV